MYRDPIGHRIKTINNLMRKTMDKKTGQRPDRVTLMHCWIIGFVQDREDSGLDTFPKDIEKDLSEEEINMFIKISDKLINNIKEDL